MEGDFNVKPFLILDIKNLKANTTDKTYPRLLHPISNIKVKDAFRTLHPFTPGYTWGSNRTNSYS